MKIFVITTDRDETQIHNISVEDGQYLRPLNVKGDIKERVEEILNHILQEKPEKVIVEDLTFRKGVSETLNKLMNNCGHSLEKDGTVNFKGEKKMENKKINGNEFGGDGSYYPEPKLRIYVKSLNFEQSSFSQVPGVIAEVEVWEDGISLLGNVKLSKEEYIDNVSNLEGYIFDKYFR